ncbi:MAG: glucose-6-phosphate isomerase [Bacteroidetes bacterium]|nr:MAG: glucose-6-phosphate isomerase [Bacteroidota bacterium]RLD93456.1 MAG: glucose-6-phosphate isomerase [Bacteroidota bacterium]RLD95384.1 MAG: glucose-6-phosphate isomerase [Bacteroidota bacterium]
MEQINLDISRVEQFISSEEIKALSLETLEAQGTLYKGDGQGNDYLGWLHLPKEISDQQLDDIEQAVAGLKEKTDILVVVGIGGSYLGARAVNDALVHNFSHLMKEQKAPHMLFAGQNIGEDYMHELLELLEEYSYSIVAISKSGTTTEPALAFRILKNHLEKKVGLEEARDRIVAVTDSSKGALRQLADEEGYRSYVIPDNVGGRFSVFTPVGLIPLAICGVNIKELVSGAKEMSQRCDPSVPFEENPAAVYAATRNALYRSGKKIELLVNYQNKLHYVSEWWKQLFGESEGKEGLGIFPAAVDNSTDLHSMGQYIQEGERTLFETVLSVEKTDHLVSIPGDPANLDQLNYLEGKNIDHVNKMAELGTILAHLDGGVPNIRISIPALNARWLGQLLYFFENACGISGYMLGVNPFNQPGVEAYKKNMFALLEKPGFEAETAQIKARL